MNVPIQIASRENEFFVGLGSSFDTERFIQNSKSVQILELSKPYGLAYFPVSSLVEASKLCRDFIKYFDIGSASWEGGQVINKEGDTVARISYNGNIWETAVGD